MQSTKTISTTSLKETWSQIGKLQGERHKIEKLLAEAKKNLATHSR